MEGKNNNNLVREHQHGKFGLGNAKALFLTLWLLRAISLKLLSCYFLMPIQMMTCQYLLKDG